MTGGVVAGTVEVEVEVGVEVVDDQCSSQDGVAKAGVAKALSVVKATRSRPRTSQRATHRATHRATAPTRPRPKRALALPPSLMASRLRLSRLHHLHM